MAGFKHGSEARVIGNGTNLGAIAKEFAAEGSIGTSDSTVLDPDVNEGARWHTMGEASGTYSATGFLDNTVALEAHEMMKRALGSNGVIVQAPMGDAVGQPGVGIVAGTTKVGVMPSVGETVGYSISGDTQNGYEPGVIILPWGAYEPGDDGAALDAGAASLGGLVWFVSVGELDGTDAEFVLQHSGDGSTWGDVDAVTVSASHSGERRVVAPGTLQKHRRVIVDPGSDCDSVEVIAALVAM